MEGFTSDTGNDDYYIKNISFDDITVRYRKEYNAKYINEILQRYIV